MTLTLTPSPSSTLTLIHPHSTLDQVQVLIDFNSDEGEAMRNAQLRELRVLNGTLQEDKDIDYKALFTNPQKAAITGPLGASAGIRAQLALPAPLSSPFEATTSASNEEAEYAKMMAEIGGLADETGDAPAGAAAAGGGAPPPAAAAPLPATPRLNHVGYAASPPGYPPRPGMPGMMPPQQHMQMQPQMPMYAQGQQYAPQMGQYGGGQYGGQMQMRPPMGYGQQPMQMQYGQQPMQPQMQMQMRPQPPQQQGYPGQPGMGQLPMPQGFGQLTMPDLSGS